MRCLIDPRLPAVRVGPRQTSKWGITVRIEHEGSFVKALSTGCNLFLGSGFSVLARNADNIHMPVGDELGNELRAAFNLDPLRELDLPQLCTIIAVDQGDELTEFLRHRFTVQNFDPRYNSLKRIHIKTIFTTNIDDLLQLVYKDSDEVYLNDVDFAGTAIFNQFAIDLVMLHGSVRNRNRPLRFRTFDVVSSFGADPDRWMFLRQRLHERPTIFLGYSLRDTATLQAIRSETPTSGISGECWIQVRPSRKTPPRCNT